MADFRKQIEEDISDYKGQYPLVADMQKDEWAFNYWVLDKFFHEDDDLILEKIIDYQDCGIDAFEWYEDTKELFLIQNKYYGSDTKLSPTYVKNTFLIEPLSVLENGTYSHCPELQRIYNENKDREEFSVRLQLYVTNDLRDQSITDAINLFNNENGPRKFAEIFYLKDIETKWYGETKRMTTTFQATIESVNDHTIMSIDNEAYHLENIANARYVFTPISCIYRMVKEAQAKEYGLFESNIREYLGNNGINKRIYDTLMNENERKNFFYYNNGITIICDKINSIESTQIDGNEHITIKFTIENPQIVNGCQTVNSVFTALSTFQSSDIESKFKDTFVMLKILEIDNSNEAEKELSKNIVTYNNSQNSIDEKTFVANSAIYARLKEEFENKGFLLLTKQSDKNTFAEKYKSKKALNSLQSRSIERLNLFGLTQLKKVTDFEIPLERLLQVVLAFKEGGLSAFTKKKDVLKPTASSVYNSVIEFLKSSNVTTDVLLNLYLLFLRAEKEKTINSKNPNWKCTTPISFYLIDNFARIECNGRSTSKINDRLSTAQKINNLIKLYTFVCNGYFVQINAKNPTPYIRMIKAEVDYQTFDSVRDMMIGTIAMS